VQMKLAEYLRRFPDRGNPVPEACAGQWIAWNQARNEMLSHGADYRQVREEALARGCTRPILQRIPRGPFVGSP
jgi:hypothetical protein